jgi:hypothetical protein
MIFFSHLSPTHFLFMFFFKKKRKLMRFFLHRSTAPLFLVKEPVLYDPLQPPHLFFFSPRASPDTRTMSRVAEKKKGGPLFFKKKTPP